MIVTQTPLRVSFLGGGTDFAEFHEAEPGVVLSSTIDKYIYVALKGRFDDRIRVGYTRTELVDEVGALEHDLVREALRVTGITGGVELSTMADIPSRGSGLGSSSAVSVSLLHALWVYRGVLPSRRRLAEGACEIEIERLGRPIGKQDQYAAAYGGLRLLTFRAGEVTVEDAVADPAQVRRLSERLMLFYTGIARRAKDVLAEQRANIEPRREALRAMRDLACQGRTALAEGRLDEFGALVGEGWRLKRGLASTITNPAIDGLVAAATSAGAIGAKITGAGGGGFLLVYAPPERQQAVRAALHGLRELEFALEAGGSLVTMNSRRH